MGEKRFGIWGTHDPTDTERTSGSYLTDWFITWLWPRFIGKTFVENKVTATTGGVTITTSSYTTVDFVIIQNTDATNYVDVTFRTAAQSGSDSKIRLLAGEMMVIPAIVKANNIGLAANTASCVCQYILLKT